MYRSNFVRLNFKHNWKDAEQLWVSKANSMTIHEYIVLKCKVSCVCVYIYIYIKHVPLITLCCTCLHSSWQSGNNCLWTGIYVPDSISPLH